MTRMIYPVLFISMFQPTAHGIDYLNKSFPMADDPRAESTEDLESLDLLGKMTKNKLERLSHKSEKYKKLKAKHDFPQEKKSSGILSKDAKKQTTWGRMCSYMRSLFKY